MTGEASRTITVEPGDDPRTVWATLLDVASSAGLGWLPAARLAFAATELVGDATGSVVIDITVLAGDPGIRGEATIRGGAGGCAVLPAGLVDGCVERAFGTRQTEHVVTVAAGAPPSDSASAAQASLRKSIDGRREVWELLAAALMTVEWQGRRLAACDAETEEFRAELDETNQGLLAVYAELEAANQRIADLVAMLSHDIRQPLGIVTFYATLLLQDWDQLDDAERRGDLARIQTAGNGMTELVEEILTLTQLDAVGLGTRAAPVEVCRVAAQAIANVSGAGPDTVVVHDCPDRWVLTDPRHLNQILSNLVSNALKYGAPPVEITATPVADAVEITVRDHGGGIPAEFLPQLFGRFARADTPTSRVKTGTGLGLYIVRQLVEANGGAVAYRNHPAGGGCFTVQLPAATPCPS
jgi:signal transduction histidine kinase